MKDLSLTLAASREPVDIRSEHNRPTDRIKEPSLKAFNVPTPCYAMARYKSTTQNENNTRNFRYFYLTRLAFGLSMLGSYTFAPVSEKFSRMGHAVFARIRNTLILGLVIVHPITNQKWLGLNRPTTFSGAALHHWASCRTALTGDNAIHMLVVA